MNKIVLILIFSYLSISALYGQEKNKPADYIPYTPEYFPIKYVRIIIHVLNKTDSIANFQNTEADKHWIKEQIFGNVNHIMKNLDKMILPYNGIYIRDSRIRYVADTILFHIDDYGWNMKCHKNYSPHCKNTAKFGNELYEKYVKNAPSPTPANNFKAVHLFLGENPGSKQIKGRASGIGDKRWVIMSGSYRLYKEKNFWMPAGLFRHEMGHSLGLIHTWNANDRCDDTPLNKGCWDGKICSNNMLDYNANQSALTACQLGYMHYYLHGNKGNISDALIRTWCKHNGDTITIPKKKHIVWKAKKHLESDIYIKKKAILEIKDTISLPEGASVIIHKKGKLIIDGGLITNNCNNYWSGFIINDERRSIKEAIKSKNLIIKNKGNIKQIE